MFLELHFLDTNELVLVNIVEIKSICVLNGITTIVMGDGLIYKVKESYADIARCIDRHYIEG